MMQQANSADHPTHQVPPSSQGDGMEVDLPHEFSVRNIAKSGASLTPLNQRALARVDQPVQISRISPRYSHSKVVQRASLAGWIAGVLSNSDCPLVRIGHQIDQVSNEAWFRWGCQPAETDSNADEGFKATFSRVLPGRGEVLERIALLGRMPGSPEMDAWVLAALGISHLNLMPTRSYGDSAQLLLFRRGGTSSELGWSVRTHREVETGSVVALVACRPIAYATGRWTRWMVGRGFDEASAVTVAALRRELLF